MAYLTIQDLHRGIHREVLSVISRSEDNALHAIAEAQAEVESYLTARYDIRSEWNRSGDDRCTMVVKLVRDIANLMKKLYLTWNRDTVEDALIAQQLMEMSDGQIVLPKDFVFTPTQELMAKGSIVNNSTKKKKKKKKRKKASTDPIS